MSIGASVSPIPHRHRKPGPLSLALRTVAPTRSNLAELEQAFIAAINVLSLSHIKILKFYWKGLEELRKQGLWNELNPYALGNY
jgi:hypothetical protein